ncbi:MAG: glycosyltransferase [Acidobacteria bacterium]|nr:glycosyltransferase [Acidobacteriota bacterium]
MLVSILTPCRCEGPYIEDFVANVESQELPPEVEIELLVAEARSEDDGYQRLSRLAADRPWLRVLDNPRRTTPAGLNIAIRQARGDVLLRMDVHTTYAPDYVAECLRALESSGADNVGGPWVARGEGFVAETIALAFQSKWSTGGGRAHDPGYEGFVDTVYLGCWRREAFARFGRFDESLIRGQDSELNFRIWLRGGRVWQTPRIRSWYQPRRSLVALFRQYAQWGYWKVAILRMHRAPASLRQLAPGLFLLGLAAGLPAAWVWPVLAAPWLGVVAAYLLANIAAAVVVCRRAGAWKFLALLPAVFAVFHFGFGYGYLRGAVDFLALRRQASSRFERLTRPTAPVREARGHVASR